MENDHDLLEHQNSEVEITEIPASPVLFEDPEDDADENAEGALEVAPGADDDGEAIETPEDLQTKETLRFSAMRKTLNGTLKDKRRLERELAEARAQLAPPAPTLGPKPTLDQFDYDEGRFSEAYEAWAEQKQKVAAAERAKEDEARREQESVETFKRTYAERAKALGVDDFAEAEADVGGMLNQTQQGLMMRASDDPAALVYALSKSPVRLIDLSKITDPVKFTAAVARLEIALSSKKSPRPAPEARITTERAASGFNASASKLEKLRAQAERTGDYTEVTRYKRENNLR